MRAYSEQSPLRYSLLAPMPGEIQDFLGVLRDRECEHTIAYGVRIIAGVDHSGACPDQPTPRQLDGDL
jgi:hypothetical protein